MPLPERLHVLPVLAAGIAAAAGMICLGAARADAADRQFTAAPSQTQSATLALAPLNVGPAWGEGNPQAGTATLHVRIDNAGVVPDRLIRVNCAPAGQASLLNGIVRDVDGVQQNGLDIPGRAEGNDTPAPVEASVSLTGTQTRPVNGSTVSCTIGFLHAGERLVVFTIGAPNDTVTEP